MKKSLSFLAIAAAATVLLSLPSAAKAQVAFGGTFQGPHGAFSIGVGGPFVPEVGVYVPSPYDDEIYQTDEGYGFDYDSEWIPCTRYGSRWVIVERPVVYGGGAYGYGRSYGYGHGAYGYGYSRPYYGHGASGYGYTRPYRTYGHADAFVGRRGFEGRREFQGRGGFQGRREFDGRQGRGSRGDGNRRSNRDGRGGWDGRR